MKRTLWLCVALVPTLVWTGTRAQESAPSLVEARTLVEARKGFETKLTREESDPEPLDPPPARYFSVVQFPTGSGEMSAYLGADPKPGGKHPAIIWLTGGFPAGGIGSDAWERVSPDNDQSAKQYRFKGLVMMYPTLRGSFGNPGVQETFFGEVDDVLAAAEYLRKVEYVDPDRIYLGGHSTGGTLALLAAESSDRFKAVFAFGPIDDISGYGPDVATFDTSNEQENRLRSPIHFLGAIKSPTFVIEGSGGNISALNALRTASKNSHLHFLSVRGADHFDVLAPVNELIAERIGKLAKDAPVAIDEKDVQKAFDDVQAADREATDLEVLAAARRAGFDLALPRTAEHFMLSRARAGLSAAATAAEAEGFNAKEIEKYEDDDGRPYYVLVVEKRVVLRDLDAVFGTSAVVARLAVKFDVQYDGWAASAE